MTILSSQPATVMSWGYHKSYRYQKDNCEGLRFEVNGLKFKGPVAILYDEGADAFRIELQNEDESVFQSVEDVFLDELVERIDELVERTDNYEADIKQWLNSSDNDNEDTREAKAIGRLISESRQAGFDGEIVIIG